jgi:hypothetical protein
MGILHGATDSSAIVRIGKFLVLLDRFDSGGSLKRTSSTPPKEYAKEFE